MKSYCYNCDKDVEINIKKELIYTTIIDKKFSYHGEKAYCDECNQEVYIRNIDDKNINKAHKMYKTYQRKTLDPMELFLIDKE